MRDYDLSRRAIRDISAARRWYDERGSRLGDRFLNAVLTAIGKAREYPLRPAEVLPGVRSIGCRRFPYRVYYVTLEDRIIIRAVYHSARDPDRWDDPDRE